jgi:galactose mutarotase-like enzyme
MAPIRVGGIDMDQHRMTGGGLTATVNAAGAELSSLCDAAGTPYLWPATAPWARHAPVLFPIVGRLKDDTLRHDGRSYHITQHGFARDRLFSWVSHDDSSCRLTLTDDDASHQIFPFAFRLDIAYRLGSDGLTITYDLANPAATTLYASIGAHPAFRWPLREGLAKDAHRLVFETEEPDPLLGVSGGLLTTPPGPSPIKGNILPLTPALFAADALILLAPRSRSVRFEAPGGPTLRVSWDGFRELGIWSRPDADLLCIEPWYGHASPPDFDGDFAEKPGVSAIPPGGQLSLWHRVEILP